MLLDIEGNEPLDGGQGIETIQEQPCVLECTYSLPPVVTPIGSRDKGGARDVSETASATLRKAESSIRQRRYVS